MAGQATAIPSAALRSMPLSIVGSGIGSVLLRAIAAELPDLTKNVGEGVFDVATRAVPLADVTRAWGEAPGSAERIVIVP